MSNSSSCPGRLLLALAACVTSLLVVGCGPLHSLLATHKYPAFDEERVERVDEPVSVVTTNVHHIRVGTLRDGRSVQWMPLEVVLRSRSESTWSQLAGHVTISDEARRTQGSGQDSARVRNERHTQRTRRLIYLLPDAFVPDTLQRPAEERARPRPGETAPLTPSPAEYEDSLEAGQLRFLAGVTAHKDWHTRLTLVCLTAPTGRGQADARCLYSGRRYSLVLGDSSDRANVPAAYPFRVENRSGPLGFVSGIALISAFVAAEVVKWGP